MEQFVIYVPDKPGELAKVSEALAKRAVNIKALSSEGVHQEAFVRIITNDIKTTEQALGTAGLRYDRGKIINLTLPDKPGELLKVTKKLARKHINVEAIYILNRDKGKTEVAVVVDDLKKADAILLRK